MKDVRNIKRLKSQLNTIAIDAEALKSEAARKQREYGQKLQTAERIKEEIEKLEGKKTPKVSEHALVRYFERVKGFNIAEIEKEILSEGVVNMVEKLGGNGNYPNKGFSVVMKNYTILTVV